MRAIVAIGATVPSARTDARKDLASEDPMRGLKDHEYAELRALDAPGAAEFHGPCGGRQLPNRDHDPRALGDGHVAYEPNERIIDVALCYSR